ncbi:unnamed protein product [Brassica rapa]|uniref:Uncharacterized protein n=1 Tax=Brassica campestris TaxID=3711 RepID=A0A8D9M4F5_BRACM|nr:unnamed protein product [Brassica rapa]
MFGRRSRLCVESTHHLESVWGWFQWLEMSEKLTAEYSARGLRRVKQRRIRRIRWLCLQGRCMEYRRNKTGA